MKFVVNDTVWYIRSRLSYPSLLRVSRNLRPRNLRPSGDLEKSISGRCPPTGYLLMKFVVNDTVWYIRSRLSYPSLLRVSRNLRPRNLRPSSDLGSEVSRSEVSRHPPFTAPEIEPGTHCWEADMATNHLPVHPQIQPLGTYLYLADGKV